MISYAVINMIKSKIRKKDITNLENLSFAWRLPHNPALPEGYNSVKNRQKLLKKTAHKLQELISFQSHSLHPHSPRTSNGTSSIISEDTPFPAWQRYVPSSCTSKDSIRREPSSSCVLLAGRVPPYFVHRILGWGIPVARQVILRDVPGSMISGSSKLQNGHYINHIHEKKVKVKNK